MWHVLSALALLCTYDLFAQFQRGTPHAEAAKSGTAFAPDLPVLLDGFPDLVSTPARGLLSLGTFVCGAMAIGMGLSDKPNPLAIIPGGVLFVAFFGSLVGILIWEGRQHGSP
jgi:hypothetical protein